jgi:hypothetical protein
MRFSASAAFFSEGIFDMADSNMHGFKFPKPVLDAEGRPVRPSAVPRNTPTQPDNAATRAAIPPLGHNDKRMEN